MTPLRITNASVDKGKYKADEAWQIARSGATDHEKYPSRIGNTLFYRDGRVEQEQPDDSRE